MIRIPMLIVVGVSHALACTPAVTSEPADRPQLQALYEADQAVRSKENMERGVAPSLQEERERRFTVFKMLADGELETANDHFRAGLILHHTGEIRHENGHSESLGTESKVLAFFLFKRAYELGHDRGQVFMAAAYNYYLDACGEDPEKFGYRFDNGKAVWRPGVAGADVDTLKCGFDPRPHFDLSDSQRETGR